MARITRAVLAHRRLVMTAWALIALAGFVSVSRATSALSTEFSLPGQEGWETNRAITQLYGNGGDEPPLVPVVTLPQGTTVDTPGVRDQLARLFARIQQAAPSTRVTSWAQTGDNAFVSSDRRTTFGLVFPPLNTSFGLSEEIKMVERAVPEASVAGAPVHLTGYEELFSNNGGGNGPGVLLETLIGGTGALLILAFVFASFLALLPLLVAAVSIVTTFLVVWGLTTFTNISFIVQFLVALIGLGVAIDYSLLIVNRWREERSHGLDNTAAVQRAMETAGVAVVFSGTTVGIGLCALIVIPVPFIRSIGIGGMLIPVMSVLVAITLLPALLAGIGPRIDWPRIRHEDHASRSWTRWARLVVRRRWIAAGVALAVLIALVVPATSLIIGFPRADSLAQSGDAHDGLAALESAGLGVGPLEPFEVLVKGSSATRVVQRLKQVQGVQSAVAPGGPGWQQAGTSLAVALPSIELNSSAGTDLVTRVEDAAHAFGGSVHIGGVATSSADFNRAVYGSFPLMVVLIIVVTFILLARAFRSLLLPFKAVVLNVMSVAAAYGVLVLVWQDGYGSKPIWGIEATHAIDNWIPLMVFAFLFGLSMDYEVFILSRMREEYDATGSTNRAVVRGIGRTGRLVTSAALILFLAFAALASGPQVVIKVFATGLATGILLDATVVRALLVPALVSLFGRWNWWLPSLPARLIRVKPSIAHPEPVSETAA
jgi:putative drug exporter of the RND superfamily